MDYPTILERFISELEETPRSVGENDLPIFFYDTLFQTISDELIDSLSEKQKALPGKGFVQIKQVYLNIQAFCRRAVDAMRRSCMDPSIGAEHKLLYQDERIAVHFILTTISSPRNAMPILKTS